MNRIQMAVPAEDLAKVIMEMNYGALRQIAAEFAAMVRDKEARPKLETTEEFADLLYDWAESKSG